MVKVQKNTVLSVLLLLLCPNCMPMEQSSLIKTPIIDELNQFKELFDRALDSSNPLLCQVLSHIRQRNGKMMRPVLVLLVAKLYGEVAVSALHAAVALELLHTASLVHDDVVDESGERRGQPSVNALYNNKVSVLVGDYMLATSLHQSACTGSNAMVEVIARLGQDLSEGELLQLSNVSNSDFSEEIYYEVIRKKTAVLFGACAQAGALSAGAAQEEIAKCRLLGEFIGICFQIKDDIFDYFSESEIGKPTGNDMHEGKLTLPVLYVLNRFRDEKAQNIALRIKSGEAGEEEMAGFIDYVKKNGGIEYATRSMYAYRDKALALLDSFAPSEVKKSLVAYLDYVVNRTK